MTLEFPLTFDFISPSQMLMNRIRLHMKLVRSTGNSQTSSVFHQLSFLTLMILLLMRTRCLSRLAGTLSTRPLDGFISYIPRRVYCW